MPVLNKRKIVAYGITEALPSIPNSPIVSNRAPTTADRTAIGTIWIDKPNNDAYFLTSIVANVATWINAGGGSGTFSSLTVTPGDITASVGNITATLGDITASAGDITATLGSLSAGTTITAGTGITATTGDITASAGDVSAVMGDVIADAGDFIAILGDFVADSGDIVATLGSIRTSAGNFIANIGDFIATAGDVTVSAGDIVATLGKVTGVVLCASGDIAGVVSQNSITNVIETTQGIGVLAIQSTTANPGANAGFIKCYVGTAVVWVPYFTNIAP